MLITQLLYYSTQRRQDAKFIKRFHNLKTATEILPVDGFACIATEWIAMVVR
jgi:hypothetical protein